MAAINDADDVRVGSVPVRSAYLGTNLVWDRQTHEYVHAAQAIAFTGVGYDGLLADGVTPMTNTTPGTIGVDFFPEVHGDGSAAQVSMQFLAAKGYKLLRYPFRWEHMQPALFGSLSPSMVAQTTAYLDMAHQYGMKVVLDLHCFGHYKTAGSPNVTSSQGGWSLGQPELPYTAFADFWVRAVNQWKNHPGLYGWEIMNEPVDMASTGGDSTVLSTPASFDSSIAGAVANSGSLTLSLNTNAAYIHEGSGSLRVVCTQYDTLWLYLTGSVVTDLSQGGQVKTLTMWVYRKPNTGGEPQVKPVLLSDTWSYVMPDAVTLTDGWNRIVFAPPDATIFTRTRRIGLQIIGWVPAGVELYVDSVQLGSEASPITTGIQHWKAASQVAVEAIRTTENSYDHKPIFVPGYEWSRLDQWVSINGNPWVNDPLGDPHRLLYTAHHYWSSTRSGNYGNESVAGLYGSVTGAINQLINTELANFQTWLTTYGVCGAITEFAWPDNAAASDWNQIGSAYLNYLNEHNIMWSYWAAGTSWVDTSYVPYKVSAHWIFGGVLNGDNAQAAVVEEYL